MTKSPLPLIAGLALLATSASAAVVVDFSISQLSASVAIGTNTSTVINPDPSYTTATSSVAFNTTTAFLTDANASYTGADVYGGAYRQQTYVTAQSGGLGNWFEFRNTSGVYSRRNGQNGTAETGAALTLRMGTLFDTGGTFTLDGTSSFSILTTGAALSAANTANFLFLQSGSSYYIGTTEVDPSGSLQTFMNLGAASFQQVTVDTTTLALGNVGGTVVGSSLTSITKAGFFTEVLTTDLAPGGPSPSITAFSADLATSTVPEPSTFAALAGLVTLGFAATRRRRS